MVLPLKPVFLACQTHPPPISSHFIKVHISSPLEDFYPEAPLPTMGSIPVGLF